MKTKILSIILIIVINVIFFNINVVQAAGFSDVITGGDSFLAAGTGQGTTIDETKLQDTSTMIYNILLILGICVAVIIAAILGIKFMIGSVEEKAQIKDSLVPFVIGCVVVFGAFGIWKIFVTIGNNVSDKTKTELVADYVTGEDGNLYKKGKLYCKICKYGVSSDAFVQGWCSQCHNDFHLDDTYLCSACGQKLEFNDFVNGKCHRDSVPISNSPFIIYH